MNLLSGIEQDFHRPQKSPGAYEWWHFDGTDEKNGYAFSIQFFAGNLTSAYYQDSLKTYWQKTKSPLIDSGSMPQPPNPTDFCGVAFRIFHNGRLAGEALQEFSSHFLKASEKQSAVMLGPNRFNWDESGDPPSYVLTVQAPIRGGKKLLRARLFFTPEMGNIPNLPKPEIPSTHTWVLAAPRCHVEGTLEWCDTAGEVVKKQGFLGRGYRDHHYGSVPLDRFVKAWHWGRAYLGDETLIYSVQCPADHQDSAHGLFLTGPQKDIQVWDVAYNLSQNRRNFFWLPYQKTLGFTDIHSLKIKHQKILSDGPASLIFEDLIEWTQNGATQKGAGMSNYLYTPRLSNRLFFPMLKGKTTVYSQRDEIQLPADPGDVTTSRPSQ